MGEKGFEGLKVWQQAHALMPDVHKKLVPQILKNNPDERFDLVAQVRRLSKSVPANIAVGHGRYYYGDNIRFCYNARGSLDETVSHLRAARDLDYCSNDLYGSLRVQAEEIRKMLNGYIEWLKEMKIGEKEPGANFHIREEPAEYLIIPPDNS